MKGSMLTLTPDFSSSLFICTRNCLEVGDVGLVVGRDVRDHDPVAMQVGGRDLLDARQVLALDRAELGEVDLRPGQQVEAAAAAGAGRLAARCAALRGAGAAPPPLANASTSSRTMRPCSPVPLTLPRSTPSSRASLRTAGPA